MTKHGAAAAAFLIAVVATAGRRGAGRGGGAARRAAGERGRAPGGRGRRSRGCAARWRCIAGLEEDVDPRALEAAVRGGTGPRAHPLVAAQAALAAGAPSRAAGRDARGEGAAGAAGAALACLRHRAVRPGARELRDDLPAGRGARCARDRAQLSGQGARRRLAIGRRCRAGRRAVCSTASSGRGRTPWRTSPPPCAATASARRRCASGRQGRSRCGSTGRPCSSATWFVRRRSIRTRSACASAAAGTGSSSRRWSRKVRWRLYARFTEPSGAPLQLDDKLPSPPPPKTGRGRGAAKVAGVASLAQLLERRVGWQTAAGGGVGWTWRASSHGTRRAITTSARRSRRSNVRCARRRPCRRGWARPMRPRTTTRRAGCWRTPWRRSRRRRGRRWCSLVWAGSRAAPARDARALEMLARGAGDRSRLLAGVAGARPGGG